MRNWIIGLALMSAAAPALACSCLATDDPQQLTQFAAEAAKDAVAVVEIETIQSYAQSNGAGDRMRVVRTIAGTAPTEFRVEREPMPSSASCDQLYEVGQGGTVILYPAQRPSSGPTYVISNLCTTMMLDKPVFRDAVIQAIGAGRAGERG